MRARLDVARLTALLDPAAAGADPFADVEATPEAIAEARGRLAADRAGTEAKLAGADREIAAKRSERAGLEAELAKIDATLPMVAERAQIRRESFERNVGSKLEFLAADQARVELESQRKVTVERAAAGDAALQALIAEKARVIAEIERDRRGEFQRAARERAEAQSELAKAERRTGLTEIVSPVEGIVQDLAVHTEGGVVQAGQQLLRVVPSGGDVMIEVVVENKDVGFVRAGQEAEVKVEAFSFTRYGFLHGRVAQVARDSAPDPEAQQSTRLFLAARRRARRVASLAGAGLRRSHPRRRSHSHDRRGTHRDRSRHGRRRRDQDRAAQGDRLPALADRPTDARGAQRALTAARRRSRSTPDGDARPASPCRAEIGATRTDPADPEDAAMKFFDLLAKLGILRWGARAAVYRNGSERPIEFVDSSVFNAERDYMYRLGDLAKKAPDAPESAEPPRKP